MPGKLVVIFSAVVLSTLHHQTYVVGAEDGNDFSVSNEEGQHINKTVTTILFMKKIIMTVHDAPQEEDEGEYSDEYSEESSAEDSDSDSDSGSDEREIAVRSFRRPKLKRCEHDICW